MDIEADGAEFLVAYPQGLSVNNPVLNSSGAGWNIAGLLADHDDVDFSLELVNHVQEDYAVDPLRVHVVGHSMGASMVYELACGQFDRIASFAAVSTQMAGLQVESCTPERPMSFLQVHGTADPNIGFDGIEGAIPFPPAPATAAFWAGLNNCAPEPVTTEIEDLATDDNSTVTLFEYTECDPQSEVLFYQVNEGGHTWPGGRSRPSAFGPTNRDINASAEILDFFARNPLPQSATAVEMSTWGTVKSGIQPQ